MKAMASAQIATDAEIAKVLRAAAFPALMRACGFRTVSAGLADTDRETDLVEVVVILNTGTWSKEADEACRRASLVCADAFAPLGVLSLPICRTRSEHEAAQLLEGNVWEMIDPDESC